MLAGVTLGVAVVIAIDLANGSAQRAFRLSTETVVGRATHQVRGGPSGVPEDFYRTLRVDWGIRDSAPVVEGIGLAADFGAQPLHLVGIDPLAEAPFRDALSRAVLGGAGLARFLTEPGAVVVDQSLADRFGLHAGEALHLQVNGRIETLHVLGILRRTGAEPVAGLDDLLLVDIATAQEVLGTPGYLTRIDVILSPQAAAGLSARLPAGLSLRPASEQAQTAAELASAFQLNLSALSLLALVVGMFLIYNTVLFAVVQRRRVLGILRALGVTREQVLALILLEAAVVSLLGSLLGLLLGWLLAQGAVRLLSQTINDLYFVVTVRQTGLSLLSALKGVGLGLAAGMAAALGPAYEAASVPSITAMQASTLEDRLRRYVPALTAAGVLLFALGGLSLMATRSLVAGFGGILAIVVAIALLSPAATLAVMRISARPLAALMGSLGRMAARTVVNALSRTSVAIAALMVALSVTIGVSLMISSFRATVVNWLDLTLKADIYVSEPAAGGARPAASLDPGLQVKLAQLPGVDEVETFRAAEVESEYGPVALTVVESRRTRDAKLYRLASGSAETVWQAVREGSVIVSEPFAYRHALPARGAHVTLTTSRGPHDFPVAAVYYDYASDRGTVLMAREVYNQYWEDRAISSLGVFVSTGSAAGDAVATIRAALQGTGLEVRDNAAVRREALRIFDRTFAITAALRILAVVVAFIGVLSALLALQIERRRELATMQALGLTPRGLWVLTLTETGLMGLTAGLLAWPTGTLLAAVLIYIINLRAFGWTIRMVAEPQVYLEALGVGVAAALLAAVYPAIALNRSPVAEHLRLE